MTHHGPTQHGAHIADVVFAEFMLAAADQTLRQHRLFLPSAAFACTALTSAAVSCSLSWPECPIGLDHGPISACSVGKLPVFGSWLF